jgi:hypothetical protein
MGIVRVADVTETALAILVVGAIVAIAVIDTLTGKPVVIPPELLGFGLLVLGSYFRGRTMNGTIHELTAALQKSQPVSPPPPSGP